MSNQAPIIEESLGNTEKRHRRPRESSGSEVIDWLRNMVAPVIESDAITKVAPPPKKPKSKQAPIIEESSGNTEKRHRRPRESSGSEVIDWLRNTVAPVIESDAITKVAPPPKKPKGNQVPIIEESLGNTEKRHRRTRESSGSEVIDRLRNMVAPLIESDAISKVAPPPKKPKGK